MSISQNTALFSLLGTNFGGDGRSTFGLPDLRGRIPLQWGQGPGLSPRDLGAADGAEAVTLFTPTVPQHSHALQANVHEANLNQPGPQNALARSNPATVYVSPAATPAPPPLQPLAAGTLGPGVGGNGPHNNLMPYLTVNFCIALQGVLPPRE